MHTPPSAVSGNAQAGVEPFVFGTLPGGARVPGFILRRAGTEVRVSAYGGVILSIRVPDRHGRVGDVVLGYDALEGYLADQSYFGALIGRHGNRIRAGRFTLDGRGYELATNNGANHLHGGPGGFHKVLWSATALNGSEAGVELRYSSPDGEEGYPGTLDVVVRYRLGTDGELSVDYEATTDAPTLVNLTQHTYFNLSGDAERDVLGHRLQVSADRFTPVDDGLIPTGELPSVAGTPFDFREPTPIGARIEEGDEQLGHGAGYDHNFVLRGNGALSLAARVDDPESGRVLEVHTSEPGLQFYSGNYLDGEITGKGGARYGHRCGFCLEPQHFPDAPNQPGFPSTVLRPGERYTSRTVYRFGTD